MRSRSRWSSPAPGLAPPALARAVRRQGRSSSNSTSKNPRSDIVPPRHRWNCTESMISPGTLGFQATAAGRARYFPVEVAMHVARLSARFHPLTIAAMRCTLSVVVVGLLARPGLAGADGVMLESYGGARPADADKLLAPLREELGMRGFSGGAVLAPKVVAKLSAEAPVLDQSRIDELKKL